MPKSVKKSKFLKTKRLEKQMAAYSAAAASALVASQAEATIFWFTNGVDFTAAQGDVGDFETFDFDFVIGGNSHVFRLGVRQTSSLNTPGSIPVSATWTNTRSRSAYFGTGGGLGAKSVATAGGFAAFFGSGVTAGTFQSLGSFKLGSQFSSTRFQRSLNASSVATTNTFTNVPPPTGPWPGNRGFARLRLDLGGTNYYGWAELSVDLTNPSAGVVVHQWAYSDIAGDNLATGAIPEPGTLWSLAAGAAGLIAWRASRRKKAAA